MNKDDDTDRAPKAPQRLLCWTLMVHSPETDCDFAQAGHMPLWSREAGIVDAALRKLLNIHDAMRQGKRSWRAA